MGTFSGPLHEKDQFKSIFRAEPTIDERPEVLHILDVIVTWPAFRSNRFQNLLTKAFHDLRVHAHEVDCEGQSTGSRVASGDQDVDNLVVKDPEV